MSLPPKKQPKKTLNSQRMQSQEKSYGISGIWKRLGIQAGYPLYKTWSVSQKFCICVLGDIAYRNRARS
jgi:hypothetical protein